MSIEQLSFSDGLCECGCGEKTSLSTVTDRRNGVVRGQPRRFIQGHRARLQRPAVYTPEEQAERDKQMRRYKRDWNRSNPATIQNARVVGRYGITLEQFEEMAAAQGNLCAICGQPERTRDRKGRIRRLCVDHCHDTGEVRGLLCMTCNQGIGALRDNPDLLEAAADYLRKAKT